MTGSQLIALLERVKSSPTEQASVPIYFATPFDSDGPSVISKIADHAPRLPVQTKSEDGITRRYPATNRSVTEDNAVVQRTPAFELYRTFFNTGFGDLSHPLPDLEVIWGIQPHEINAKWLNCADLPESRLEGLAWLFFDSKSLTQTCPFTGTIPVTELLSPFTDSDIDALIRGKIVLYGAELIGATDSRTTPIHDAIPGVYLHAMALDNLIARDETYLRRNLIIRDDMLSGENSQTVLELMVFLVLLALFTLFCFKNELIRRQSLCCPNLIKGISPFCRRRLNLFVFFVQCAVVAALSIGICFFLLNLAPYNWIGLLGLAIGFSFWEHWHPR